MLRALTILVVATPVRFRVADGDASFVNPFSNDLVVLGNDEETKSSWVTLEAGTRLGFVGGSEQTGTYFFVLEGEDDRARPSLGFGTGIVVRKMSWDKILASTAVVGDDEEAEVEDSRPEVPDYVGMPTLDEAAA